MMVVPSIASDQFAAIRCDHAAPMVLADQPGAAPDGAAPDGAAADESSRELFATRPAGRPVLPSPDISRNQIRKRSVGTSSGL